MTAVAFDTLKLARKLRDSAHMTQEQAEGVADALAEAMSGAELATKSDIRELAAATRSDIRELAATTRSDISQLAAATKSDVASIKTDVADAKTEILRWVFAAAVGQTALIVTLLKVWH